MDTCVCNAHSLLTTLAPSGDEPVWWNPLGSVGLVAAVRGAYRAQASAGSPWGNAPANYTESLTNWANPGVNDLTEIGGGSVNWVAATGWSGFSALNRCLNTGLVPTNDQSWVMFLQFSGGQAGTWYHAGAYNGVSRMFALIHTDVDNRYGNGGFISVAPQLLTGNTAVIGARGYRNGVIDGGVIGVWVGASAQPTYIGALNNSGVAAFFAICDIQAVAIYDDASAFTPADITAIAAVGAGSMHNL